MRMTARKRYSVLEIYRIAHAAVRAAPYLRDMRDRRLTERIMLAVTEVNGCALCSYGHARLALRAGLSDAEVRGLLGGVTSEVPDHHLVAIAFGQHYADTRGHPDAGAWREVVDTYGKGEALGVLAATRMIMLGNATGIPLSALLARLRGEPEPGSSLGYEVGALLGTAAVAPVAVVHALVSMLRRRTSRTELTLPG